MAAQSFAKINLLPKDAFEFSALGRTLKWTLTTGRVLVVLTEFVVILAFGSRFYYDRTSNDLADTIDQKQAVVESYVDVEKQVRDVLAREKAVDLYLAGNLQIKDRLAKVAGITPADVKYDDIDLSSEVLNLAGTAGSEAGFYQEIAGLTSLPFISQVTVSGIQFDQRQGLITFKVSGAINKTKT